MLITVLARGQYFLRHTKERMEMAIFKYNISGTAEQNLVKERVLLKPKGIPLSNHKSVLTRVMLLELLLQERFLNSFIAEN